MTRSHPRSQQAAHPVVPAPATAPAPDPDPAPCALSAERIVVGESKITITVALAPDAPRYMTPSLAQALVRRVPSLPHHACVNSAGPTFGAIIGETSVPHVLEHLIIDGQCAGVGTAHEEFLFMGTTEWLNESAGRAVIEVNYADDVIALRALRDGLDLLNGLLTDF